MHTRTRLAALIVLCLMALSAGVCRAQDVLAPFKLGVIPYLSPGTLINEYAGLRDYLAAELKRPVVIHTAPDVRRFVARTKARHFDILLTAPHLVSRAVGDGYLPLMAVRADFYAHVLVPAVSSKHNMRDLLGSRIHAPPRSSFASIAIDRFLIGLGYQIERDFLVQRHNSENNALLAAARSNADAVAASRAVVQRLPADIREKLRVVGSTPAAVSMLIMAAPQLAPADLRELQGALTRFPYSREGLLYAEQRGAYVFPVTKELMRSIEADIASERGRAVGASGAIADEIEGEVGP